MRTNISITTPTRKGVAFRNIVMNQVDLIQLLRMVLHSTRIASAGCGCLAGFAGRIAKREVDAVHLSVSFTNEPILEALYSIRIFALIEPLGKRHAEILILY